MLFDLCVNLNFHHLSYPRLYKAEGSVTPEIQAVADYALEQIGDCSGNQEHVYLSLRVCSTYFIKHASPN